MAMHTGEPYLKCCDCAADGHCMLYGHYCGIMRCDGKPDSYQPDEDTEIVATHHTLVATNIKWDTDGEDVDLPTEISITNGMTDAEEISDYITDLTGFCHFGFDLEYRK